MSAKKIQDKFKSNMEIVGRTLDKPPSLVTRTEFIANSPEEISDWDMRKAGGFATMRKILFVPAIEEAESMAINAFQRDVKKQVGQTAFLNDQFIAALKEYLKKNPLKAHKVSKKRVPKKKAKRTLVTQWSDLHYGCIVDKNEMGGVNEWDWTIAARRTAGLIKCIAEYKPHYRKDTDLVIGLNGDIIAGIIHNIEWFAEPLATQVGGTMDILFQAISYLAQEFNNVEVHCQTGNHGRQIHKQDKGRATCHKWDSYETMIYRGLEMALRPYKNVSINIPETPYSLFKVQGHNFYMTHGDTVFNVGVPGKSINIEKLDKQITKLNTTLMDGKENLAVVMVGHVHTPTYQLTDAGAALFVNGCMIGNDPFAQSIGLHHSQPAQWLFEVTEQDPVGDQRLIKLARYDSDKTLDSIITPFTGKF